jgi:hypothetical protein
VSKGFAQTTSADLIAELEVILPELRRRLDDYRERYGPAWIRTRDQRIMSPLL